jgi:GAF domain-containing protein
MSLAGVEPALAGGLLLASDLLRTRRALQPILDLTTSIAADSIFTASGAGLSLIAEDGTKSSMSSTHPLVAAADDRQYEFGEGPCLTSWADNVVVRIDDLNLDTRWPRWNRAARELHLRSVLSTPVYTGSRIAGAMKLYSDRPRAFDRAAENLLLRFAEQAGILVDNLQTLSAAEESSAAIRNRLQSRQLIAVAQGVLVERHEISTGDAFLRLSDAARRSGRTVAEEAADVMAGR